MGFTSVRVHDADHYEHTWDLNKTWKYMPMAAVSIALFSPEELTIASTRAEPFRPAVLDSAPWKQASNHTAVDRAQRPGSENSVRS
jgi:hypothetical protein